jgi:hypothetical protein
LLNRHCAASALGSADSIQKASVASKRMAEAVGRDTTIEDAGKDG